MPPTTDPKLKALDAAAREFAQQCSDLLNLTVTDGIRFSYLRFGTRAVIGVGITKSSADAQPIPLCVGKGKPRAYLYVQHSYGYDPEQKYLTMLKSTIALYTSEAMLSEELIVSYDYARDTPTAFPEAHLHVYGDRSDLDGIYLGDSRDSRQLRDLHFPVGGRRLRPTLEDVVEFAILEEMVEPRDEWQQAISAGRERWMRVQLMAMVRRSPSAAAKQLSEEGWTCSPPD